MLRMSGSTNSQKLSSVKIQEIGNPLGCKHHVYEEKLFEAVGGKIKWSMFWKLA